MLVTAPSVVSVANINKHENYYNRMADIPLTEKRFLELLDIVLDKKLEEKLEQKLEQKLEEKLEEKLEKILDKKLEDKLEKKFEEKLAPIYSSLKALHGFQKHESDAIEYELEEVLETYLKNEYQLMKIERFPMKSIHDPKTQKEITEFDAAFLLQTTKYYPDYSRLKKAGLPIPKTKPQYTDDSIFVLAEAKHYIDTDKIKQKLAQFDRICELFNIIKMISKIPENERKPEDFGVDSKFLKTILHNKYLAHINKTILFFGAAFWKKGLLKDFKNDINIYKNLVTKFNSNNNEKRIHYYREICRIEHKWYNESYSPNSPTLSDEEILKLNIIDTAMIHVNFIEPSGGRYIIATTREKEPFGITSIPLRGGKSKKRRANLSNYNASENNS